MCNWVVNYKFLILPVCRDRKFQLNVNSFECFTYHNSIVVLATFVKIYNIWFLYHHISNIWYLRFVDKHCSRKLIFLNDWTNTTKPCTIFRRYKHQSVFLIVAENTSKKSFVCLIYPSELFFQLFDWFSSISD